MDVGDVDVEGDAGQLVRFVHHVGVPGHRRLAAPLQLQGEQKIALMTRGDDRGRLLAP